MASYAGFTHLSSVQGVPRRREVRAAAGTSHRDAPTAVDCRRILGVGPNASRCEVKAAYRKLALRYHPDVCRGDECDVRFVEVNRAYESLMALQSSHQGRRGEPAVACCESEAAQTARPSAQNDDPWVEFLQSLVNGTHEELREDYSYYYSNLRCYGSKARRSKLSHSGSFQYYQGNW